MNTAATPAGRSPDTLYCAGCNERFAAWADDRTCPRCGAKLADDGERALAETLLIRPGVDHSPGAVSFAAQEPDNLIGRQLHVYVCESLLGAGGMGRVYLAHHQALGRKCALKILSPKLAAQDADYVARFQQEARAAAALVHPNIVTAHAIGYEQGYHFLEMEFLAGQSLQQLVAREGALNPVRATALALQIAEGLAAAHRERIIHRDLKPDNVLLTRKGIAKIADFGLAKRIAAHAGTPERYLVGTPNYMAPELFEGVPASPNTDVYALGVCYFLLLTGRLPFICGNLAELRRVIREEAAPPVRSLRPEIPLEMAECLTVLLSKTPHNRPRDGIEAAQLLRAVLGQVRDLESLLVEAFSEAGTARWTRIGDGYEVLLVLPDGRRQQLFIEPSSHAPAERLLLIYSICCDARPDYYEQALRLNSEIPHGGLAIREIDGVARFVMIDTYPRATVDPEEIRRSALEVALRADALEALLTGADSN